MLNSKSRLRSSAAGAALFISIAAGVPAAIAGQSPVVDPPTPAAIAGHLARAKELAGQNPLLQNMAAEGYWCMTPAKASALVRQYTSKPFTDAVPPAQLFDNVYLFGTAFVSMMVLKTSDGLIVWDALNNEEEVRTIFEPGMKQLGLNMADIKIVIVTHGHFDHFGGAKYLQDKYNIPIALSAADWDLMTTAPGRTGGPMPPVRNPARDKTLTDGQEIKIGDATVRIVLTPGHSPGTVSSIIPVKDGGTTRMMAAWGGTAFPATTAMLTQMRDSTQKLKEAGRAAGAVGILNTHAFFYDLVGRKAKQGSSPTNPLVIGADALAATMDIKRECLTGQLAWYAAMGK